MSLNLLYPLPKSSTLLCSSHTCNNRATNPFKISSSYYQTGSRTTSTRSKNRINPRRSFSEQVLEKWGVKNTSVREKFTWQRRRKKRLRLPSNEIEEEDEEEEEESHQFVGESRIGLVSNSVNFGNGNKIKVAPWVKERKPRKIEGKKNEGFDCEKGKSGNVAIVSGVLERKGDFSGKNDERVLFKRNGLSNDGGNFQNFEGFSDKFDSDKLTLERKIGLENDPIRIGLLGDKESLALKINENVSLNQEMLKIGRKMAKIVGSGENYDSTKQTWDGEIGSKNVEGEKGFVKSNTWLAEKMLPEHELNRLRNVALRMVERIQVEKAGITQALVDSIHEKWNVDEVVKLKFEGSSAMNMKRTHEHLESRTGGLVIWRSGSSVVLFRGLAYKLSCVQQFNDNQMESDNKVSSSEKALENGRSRTAEQNKSISSVGSPINHSSRESKDLSEEELVELNKLNLLLDGLGPRYTDWNGRDPVPVDADLLPSVIYGYKPPFRYLPHGIRHSLKESETTFYRRNARTMHPHFVLGRNRELQGLAAAMVKLWDRSAIAKITIKSGVYNTSNERMAEELKLLTGGTLLSRTKDYIVFHRGKDFLPPRVTKTLEEAKEVAALQLDEEDQARQKAAILIDLNRKVAMGPLVAGTLAETIAATSRWGKEVSDEDREKMMRESAVARHASLVKYLEKKLAIAKGKITMAEKALRKVQEKLDPSELPTDLETLTDEERFLFRKMGLSMKPCLFLGRRGVFDGTIENMHLHWKYRELVKIFVEGKKYAQVKHVAIMLEAESGGVLVSVEKTTKGYAIIVYRGKNYRCPYKVKPTNLLTRRQALARSIELQRREALKHHVSELKGRIEKLKSELEDMKTIDEIDEATLYSRVDDRSDDDDPDFNEEQHFFMTTASQVPNDMPTRAKIGRKSISVGGPKLNRFKKYETAAFRPTTPGPSPGVGNHHSPPAMEVKG